MPELKCLDEIDQIVEKAITYTRTVLQAAPEHLDGARAGLARLRSNLLLEYPDHPALERLRSFLDDLEVRAAEQPFH